MKHRRPPRLRDEDYIGATRIFFTMCLFHRHDYFADAAIVSLVLDQLLRAAPECGVEITAYCFMPDHLHLLLTGTTPTADLKDCATLFRQRAGYVFRRANGRRLWQEGYFDQTLRDTDATFDVVAYIVANPVVAGLCASAVDYTFSGSGCYQLQDLVSDVQWRPDSMD